ncbi:hypothetical protein KM043_010841 [Ampulex compressa]|nr:hypothetical protein KM043_010841 [Ampulex compressa]
MYFEAVEEHRERRWSTSRLLIKGCEHLGVASTNNKTASMSGFKTEVSYCQHLPLTKGFPSPAAQRRGSRME